MSTTLRSTFAALTLTALLTAMSAGCGSDGSDGAPAVDESPAASASADVALDTLVQTGLDQLAAGDETAATGTFQNVLTIDPTNVFARYNLGVIAQGQGDAAGAMVSYDEALATDPAFGPALYNKAILTETSDLDASVTLYRKAIEADPTFAPAFMRLGFALVHLGQEDEGADVLEEGIRLDPTMADVAAPSYD